MYLVPVLLLLVAGSHAAPRHHNKVVVVEEKKPEVVSKLEIRHRRDVTTSVPVVVSTTPVPVDGVDVPLDHGVGVNQKLLAQILVSLLPLLQQTLLSHRRPGHNVPRPGQDEMEPMLGSVPEQLLPEQHAVPEVHSNLPVAPEQQENLPSSSLVRPLRDISELDYELTDEPGMITRNRRAVLPVQPGHVVSKPVVSSTHRVPVTRKSSLKKKTTV